MHIYDEEPREPKPWWPAKWPLWAWQIVFLLLAAIVTLNSDFPAAMLYNMVIMWLVIFGSIYIWRAFKRAYQVNNNRKSLDALRMEEEYHGLSPEEAKIWDDIKNKLDK